MLDITENALEKLAELLASQGGGSAAIRIAVMGGGPTESGLGLLVDGAADSDVYLRREPFPIIIDRQLVDYCKKISVSFAVGGKGSCGGSSGSGFIITAEQPLNF